MQALDGLKDVIHILVAGYTRIHAELLADVLKRDRGIRVEGVVSSSQEALELAASAPIDVAIISSNLDEQPERGFDVLQKLRAKYPRMRVIMLLDSARRESIVKAFRSGAKGIVSKNSPLLGLSKCVRCVHEGQVWINQQELAHIIETLSSIPAISAVDAKGISLLTKREREVVECVAEGLANNEIAERLQLSRHTVKNYLFHVFDKLGAANRVELLFLTLSGVLQRVEDPDSQTITTRRLANGSQHEVDVPQAPGAAYSDCVAAERTNRTEGMQTVKRKRVKASVVAGQTYSVERQDTRLPKEKPAQSTIVEPRKRQNNSSCNQLGSGRVSG